MRRVLTFVVCGLVLIAAVIFVHPASIPELPALRADRIEIKGNTVALDFETLGDYPTEVRTFSISIVNNPSQPVFTLQADPGELVTHSLRFHTGKNASDLVDPEEHSYRVIAPKTGDGFVLVPGQTYVARLCRRNFLRSKVIFTMPNAT